MKVCVALLVVALILSVEARLGDDEMMQKRCVNYPGKCTSDSNCCDKVESWSGRKLRCLQQTDEGGPVPYKQCLYHSGIQK